MKHFLFVLIVLLIFFSGGCLEEQSDPDFGGTVQNYTVYNLKPRAIEIVRNGLLTKPTNFL